MTRRQGMWTTVAALAAFAEAMAGTLPSEGLATASVAGVTGREFIVGSGVFLDRAYLCAKLPEEFGAVNFIPVPMDGQKTLEVMSEGRLMFLVPNATNYSSRAELAAQGFCKLDVAPVVLWGEKKKGCTLRPASEHSATNALAASVWSRPCKAGEKVSFGAWAVPLVRRESRFVPSQPQSAPYAGAASRVKPKHVVVVGFDGFAGCHYAKAKLPVLDALRAEGAWSMRSRTVFPSNSSVNWHAIFTCCATEQNGYNTWDAQTPVIPAAAVSARGYTPDVFAELRAVRPNAKIDFICEWEGVLFCADVAACSFTTNVPMKAGATTDVVCRRIREQRPDLLYVHYDSPDDAGHAKGWGSPEYLATTERKDAELGKIVKAIREAGIWDETVLVVTSDHGGKNRGHGGYSADETERLLVFAGKGVRRDCELKTSSAVYDTGATLAALLGIVPPQVWIGRPIDEAFALYTFPTLSL